MARIRAIPKRTVDRIVRDGEMMMSRRTNFRPSFGQTKTMPSATLIAANIFGVRYYTPEQVADWLRMQHDVALARAQQTRKSTATRSSDGA